MQTNATAITVMGQARAKGGHEANVRKGLHAFIEPARKEDGCIAYDLHRSHEDPGLFIFTESWESRPLWEDHLKAPHLVAFGKLQGELTDSRELFVGEKI